MYVLTLPAMRAIAMADVPEALQDFAPLAMDGELAGFALRFPGGAEVALSPGERGRALRIGCDDPDAVQTAAMGLTTLLGPWMPEEGAAVLEGPAGTTEIPWP